MSYELDTPLAALAGGTRRRILDLLAVRPCSVADLARQLPVSQPAVSQHLKVLKSAGLVQARREGARTVHRIDPAGLAPIRAWLDRLWDEELAAFKVAAETADEGFKP